MIIASIIYLVVTYFIYLFINLNFSLKQNLPLHANGLFNLYFRFLMNWFVYACLQTLMIKHAYWNVYCHIKIIWPKSLSSSWPFLQQDFIISFLDITLHVGDLYDSFANLEHYNLICKFCYDASHYIVKLYLKEKCHYRLICDFVFFFSS